MSPLLLPLQILLIVLAGWVNRRQLDVIAYLQEENRVLKERLASPTPNVADSPEKRKRSDARV
jgi:hypothetical protein